ncbi:MAG TPA: hypothetical protein VK424_00560 [Thermoplasmata archaeon]|nr:hypothetical protein [Thermoplasmata archaeon]
MATTIQLDVATRDQLRSLGHKGETYDSVIRRLLKAARYSEFMEEQYSILKEAKGWRKLEDIP